MSDILARAKAWQGERFRGGQTASVYLNFCKNRYVEARDKIVPELIAECEGLRKVNATADKALVEAMQIAVKAKGAESEWRQKAIEERAMRLFYRKTTMEFPMWTLLPEIDQKRYREQAERELEAMR